jgi:hypothetical protein
VLTLTGNNELAIEIGQEFQRVGYRGVLLKCLADLLKQSQIKYVSPIDIATIHVRLGDVETALDWLEKAIDERTWYLGFLKVRPTWIVCIQPTLHPITATHAAVYLTRFTGFLARIAVCARENFNFPYPSKSLTRKPTRLSS